MDRISNNFQFNFQFQFNSCLFYVILRDNFRTGAYLFMHAVSSRILLLKLRASLPQYGNFTNLNFKVKVK